MVRMYLAESDKREIGSMQKTMNYDIIAVAKVDVTSEQNRISCAAGSYLKQVTFGMGLV